MINKSYVLLVDMQFHSNDDKGKTEASYAKPVADNLHTKLEKFRYFMRLHRNMCWYQSLSCFSFYLTTGGG